MAIVQRDDKGRFLPGQSGNPAGKQKGLRNYITHERLMLEAGLRDYIADPAQAKKLLTGIDRVLDIAVAGEDKDAISAMKLLLDRVMPAMPPKEAEEAEKTDRRLTIQIITNPDAKVPVQAVIDGEFTEIEESPMPTPGETPSKQNPDTRQGGEGTVSLHNTSNDALLKSLGKPGNDHENVQSKESGTK
jgi:hypothetical protein